MKDPKLVADGSPDAYTYQYDAMGRREQLTYPANAAGVIGTEKWTYDIAGNLYTSKNRAGNVQTFSYDVRNRSTGFTWTGGTQPLTLVYDDGSRLLQINNTDANITNVYYDTGQLKSQTQQNSADSTPRTINYTYKADFNRDTIKHANTYNLQYTWTGRGQLSWITDLNASAATKPVQYTYDPNGNITTSIKKIGSTTVTSGPMEYNAMDMCTHVVHGFQTPRTFDYRYDKMNNRTGVSTNGGATWDNYAYDLAQQSTSQTSGGTSETYAYDPNGNRSAVNGSGTYAYNKLSQVTTFNGLPVTYDGNGNVKSYDGGSFTYDAQNRLIAGTKGTNSLTFKYDGFGRRVSQKVGANPAVIYVYDGWNLIEEFTAGSTAPNHVYMYGTEGIVQRFNNGNNANTSKLYFHDALGSVTHVANAAGTPVESYVYDRFGQITIYDGPGTKQRGATNDDVRHQFTGELRIPQLSIYDLRNRVYSPSLTRFLQPDPIGFAGDPTNQYRYCGNNPVNATDPLGLYGFWDDLAFVAGGAAVGVVIQGATDLAAGSFSGWNTYGASAIGGAAGGWALLYTGPVGAGAVAGMTTELAKQGLDNLASVREGYNLTDVGVSTVIGAMSGKLPVDRVPGLSSGRGNYNAIFLQMRTKFRNGTIQRVTPRTAYKMVRGRFTAKGAFPGGLAGSAAGRVLGTGVQGGNSSSSQGGGGAHDGTPADGIAIGVEATTGPNDVTNVTVNDPDGILEDLPLKEDG